MFLFLIALLCFLQFAMVVWQCLKFKLARFLSLLLSFPFVIRKGSRLGHDTIVDGMLKDGLWDVYNDFGMGVCAEICADRYTISREEQVVLC